MVMLKRGSIPHILILLTFLVSVALRINAFDQEGGDHRTYKQAVNEFRKGISPYHYTILSYRREDLKHGYASLPTLLYIQSFLVGVNSTFSLDQPTKYLWKIPVLLADIGIGVLLYKILKEEGFSNSVILAGLLFWFFNPYFVMRYEYTNYEVLPVFFLFLGLLTVGRKDFWSGIFFALSVTLKTFPIILFAVFMLKSKNVKHFILAGMFVGILVSIPFLGSARDFNNYINGALLVHTGRGIQGRPFFSFLTYSFQDYGVTFLQSELNKVYTAAALFGAQLLPLYLYKKKKVENIWILTFSSFIMYYLFTPVLNRTHLIWGTPFFFLGGLYIYKEKLTTFYLGLVLYVLLVSCYYLLWTKGLRNPTTFGGDVWIDPVFEDRPAFALFHALYVRAIQIKRAL